MKIFPLKDNRKTIQRKDDRKYISSNEDDILKDSILKMIKNEITYHYPSRGDSEVRGKGAFCLAWTIQRLDFIIQLWESEWPSGIK